MKRIYLVKKDSGKPGSAENWITMTSEEYCAFLDTEEGKTRKPGFGRLDGCDEDDAVIIAECGKATAEEWQRDRNRERYRRNRMTEYPEPDTLFGGFPEPEEEMPSGVLLVPDEDADTEMTVMEKIMREELRKAVRSLPPGERDLIILLYLKEEPLSEKEYAERVGARRGQVNSMKEKVLEKLRDTLSGRARREPRRLS